MLHFNLILLHVFITFTRKVQNSISFQVVEIMTRKIGNGKKKRKKKSKNSMHVNMHATLELVHIVGLHCQAELCRDQNQLERCF